MKALTLTQPWATLVALGIKQVETRSWPTAYRGPLAIHAAKGWSRDDREYAEELHERGILPVPSEDLPLGAVVATCRLQYVGPTHPAFAVITPLERELGDYTPGRFGWTLTRVRCLPEPIPARGSLGLWEWAPDPIPDFLERTRATLQEAVDEAGVQADITVMSATTADGLPFEGEPGFVPPDKRP